MESCRAEQVGSEGFVGRSMFRGWMEVSLLVGGVEGLGSSSPGWLPDWLPIALLGPPSPPLLHWCRLHGVAGLFCDLQCW